MSAVVAAVAALVAGAQAQVASESELAGLAGAGVPAFPAHVHPYRAPEGRRVLVAPPHPYNVVDSVRRPGFNGRLWTTRPIIGGAEFPFHTAFAGPGPEAYGEYDSPYVLVPVRVGLLRVEVSPWERYNDVSNELEEGRQQWLREQNYTGGVRTFVNDLYYWGPALGLEPAADEAPEPAMIIPLPEDMPRIRHRMQVDASDVSGAPAILLSGAPTRVSWPMNAPAEIVARSERAQDDTRLARAER